MPAALLALLGALPQILADVPSFAADWAAVRSLFSPTTQAAVDALIQSQQTKTAADVAQLEADAGPRPPARPSPDTRRPR